jgi:hypothetical protein
MLDVTLYNIDGEVIQTFHDDDNESVDYVSLVSNETYGPPALIAPARGRDAQGPRARAGETVLYINTGVVPFWDITRLEED